MQVINGFNFTVAVHLSPGKGWSYNAYAATFSSSEIAKLKQ